MAPTGVAMRDPQQRLFGAAERILLRDGPGRLTSREVTDEAGCAKGVLHRYFSSFDSFLAEFALDRTSWLEVESTMLVGAAGTGNAVDLIVDALRTMLDPTRLAVVRLVSFRTDVREQLRERWLTGIPVLVDIGYAIGGFLRAERDSGRLELLTAPEVLGRAIVGAAYQLLIDGDDVDGLLREEVAELLRTPSQVQDSER